MQCFAHDCDRLRVHRLVPEHMASFFDDPEGWREMVPSERWLGLIDKLFFAESVTDRKKSVDDSSSSRQLAFACSRCDCSFASQRALESPGPSMATDYLSSATSTVQFARVVARTIAIASGWWHICLTGVDLIVPHG